LGISAEAAADVVESVFQDLGRPNGFIKGGETSGAIGIGLRYGEGDLTLAGGGTRQVYWQGPSPRLLTRRHRPPRLHPRSRVTSPTRVIHRPLAGRGPPAAGGGGRHHHSPAPAAPPPGPLAGRRPPPPRPHPRLPPPPPPPQHPALLRERGPHAPPSGSHRPS